MILEDDTLPHQIRLRFVGQNIAVTCTCIQRVHGAALEMRTRWTTAEAFIVYNKHLEAEGHAVRDS